MYRLCTSPGHCYAAFRRRIAVPDGLRTRAPGGILRLQGHWWCELRGANMQALETTTSNGNRLLQSDLLLALHIAVPLAVCLLDSGACPPPALVIPILTPHH